MEFIKTELQHAQLIKPKIYGDSRGFFLESWRQDLFDQNLNNDQPLNFVQDNHSSSSQGVLRGLHYQLVHPQGKLVRVMQGEIYDVIVDLRPTSPTFGKWQGFHLSAANSLILWVPPGFAHGFYVLSEKAEFVYKCTAYYYPEYERSLLWNDPHLNINWPLIDLEQPILSEKDRLGKTMNEAELYS